MFSHYETWLILIPFVALLAFGCRFMKRGQWNENVLSYEHTKAFLGFCAIGIILHHCAERTSAAWINPIYIRPGLELFVDAGYLFVAAFFFCSGFGLYKSSRKGKMKFGRFCLRRIVPILVPTVVMEVVFILLRINRGMKIRFPDFFALEGPENIIPYVWFIPVLIIFYLAFYLCFCVNKKDGMGIALMVLIAELLIVFFLHYQYGLWWYNTYHLFIIGILFAKYEEKITGFSKRYYIPLIIVMLILTCAGFIVGNYYWMFLPEQMCTVTLAYVFMAMSAFTSVYLTFLIGLKVKIGNPILRFLGKQTLEIYLTQAVFVYGFSFFFVKDYVKPFFYIENVALYTFVVVITTLIASYPLYLLDSYIHRKTA